MCESGGMLHVLSEDQDKEVVPDKCGLPENTRHHGRERLLSIRLLPFCCVFVCVCSKCHYYCIFSSKNGYNVQSYNFSTEYNYYIMHGAWKS